MATGDVPMDSAICMPVTAPSATASMTLVLFPLLSILTLPASRTSSVWGRSILATMMLPTGIGLSVCPRNMLATATKLSTSEVPISLPTALPIHFTTNPKIPI